MNKKDKVKAPIEFEAPVEEEVEQSAPEADIDDLQQEIENLKCNIEEMQNSYLRVMADFDNYRKRQRDDLAQQKHLIREDIIGKVLGLIDNLDRTVLAAEAEHSYESLMEGVTLTLKSIREVLAREGLQPIEAVGQEFDPNLHEAMFCEESDECEHNIITEELEKGYMLNGRVLRPSKVKVAINE